MAAACGSSRSSAVTVPAVSASGVGFAARRGLARRLRARFASHRRGPSPCPPGLEALAPQDFHPSVDDPFNDLVAGTKRSRVTLRSGDLRGDRSAGLHEHDPACHEEPLLRLRRLEGARRLGADGKTVDADARGRIDLDMVEDARGQRVAAHGRRGHASATTNLEVLGIEPVARDALVPRRGVSPRRPSAIVASASPRTGTWPLSGSRATRAGSA